jgi:O-antigen ligase
VVRVFERPLGHFKQRSGVAIAMDNLLRYPRSTSYRPSRRVALEANDRYLLFLMLVLGGYAILDKGFAYVGYSPFFIGEITLALGIIALAWSSATFAVISSPVSLLLLLLIAWVVARTVPYVGSYGIDALRDAVIVLYSIFALVIAGLLIERPRRLGVLISGYRRLAVVFAFVAPPLFVVSSFFIDSLPVWPVSNVPLLALKPGDVAVHLCGVMLFALLGFVRLPLVSIVSLFIGIVIVGSQSRGGTLAILVPVVLACVAVPKMKQLPRVAGIGGATLLVCSVLGLSLALPFVASERLMSESQFFKNVSSIFFSSSNPILEGTVTWRIDWWHEIIGYTLHGPYFWTGKGFGINLAAADGFQGATDALKEPLRSPHNSHLTILARAGVPGFLLWAGVCAAWTATMVRRIVEARLRGQDTWARLFVFILGYWMAVAIDAAFDVALEGPMLGIWFWTLFGVGLAASRIYASENVPVVQRGAQRRAHLHSILGA